MSAKVDMFGTPKRAHQMPHSKSLGQRTIWKDLQRTSFSSICIGNWVSLSFNLYQQLLLEKQSVAPAPSQAILERVFPYFFLPSFTDNQSNPIQKLVRCMGVCIYLQSRVERCETLVEGLRQTEEKDRNSHGHVHKIGASIDWLTSLFFLKPWCQWTSKDVRVKI